MTQRDYGDGLYLDSWPGELRLALMKNGRLEDYCLERSSRPVLNGALFAGRVRKVQAELDAAFVDLGRGVPDGLLPLNQVEEKDLSQNGTVAEGQWLACRVQREAFENKGPRLTARLSNAERESVQSRIRENGKAGLISRPDPLEHWLEPYRKTGLPFYFTQSDQLARFRGLPGGLGTLVPEHCPQETALFERARIEEELDALLMPEVPLPSGGSLLIEQTRTLCAVDVNAAQGLAAGGSAKKAALRLSLEAVGELMRQLRLRNIGGRVVVDLPVLKGKAEIGELFSSLKRWALCDPVSVKLLPLHLSGLLELTRHRKGHALRDLMAVPAGLDGMGARLSGESLNYRSCRAVLREGLPAWQALPEEKKKAILDSPLGEALQVRTGLRLTL
ncbi:ribonuclease E/G [Kiloniella sp. b19]|uniref:ribonuclease E/G n=1 Tax=Kiloniella sp. GXU_MW_B19 TaxID=3141326 RepID=UPI0031D44212